jgi:hypothetical protein
MPPILQGMKKMRIGVVQPALAMNVSIACGIGFGLRCCAILSLRPWNGSLQFSCPRLHAGGNARRKRRLLGRGYSGCIAARQ